MLRGPKDDRYRFDIDLAAQLGIPVEDVRWLAKAGYLPTAACAVDETRPDLVIRVPPGESGMPTNGWKKALRRWIEENEGS